MNNTDIPMQADRNIQYFCPPAACFDMTELIFSHPKENDTDEAYAKIYPRIFQ